MAPELARLKAVVVEAARAAGAAAVAIAPARPDAVARRRMADSFARGDLATWKYGDAYAAAASDPSEILPGARSVVCIALPYASAAPGGRAPLSGRISNYAWSRDYHTRVRAVLDRIVRTLDDAAGARVAKAVCDTAPLAERAFAASAGLGWIGKHTNVISPALGSFVFLGEVVTTLELPPDTPLKKTCGSCRHCVVSCPTGALRGDYTIDATRCISDITQRTDAIPRELRALVGDWVWGCDICQIVCPPTRRASEAGVGAFAASNAEAAFPALVELLVLRGGAFRRRFGGTALAWRGAAVLRRNAAVALGNSLDRAGVPPLAGALRDDPHHLVRGHAAWALGRIASPPAREALRTALSTESEPSVREEITAALASWETFTGRTTSKRAK